MKPVPEQMAREIGAALKDAETAHARATSLLRSPAGHPPERLEDALNELQDAGYRARSAFRPGEFVR
jgi:hypothetical protein